MQTHTHTLTVHHFFKFYLLTQSNNEAQYSESMNESMCCLLLPLCVIPKQKKRWSGTYTTIWTVWIEFRNCTFNSQNACLMIAYAVAFSHFNAIPKEKKSKSKNKQTNNRWKPKNKMEERKQARSSIYICVCVCVQTHSAAYLRLSCTLCM